MIDVAALLPADLFVDPQAAVLARALVDQAVARQAVAALAAQHEAFEAGLRAALSAPVARHDAVLHGMVEAFAESRKSLAGGRR